MGDVDIALRHVTTRHPEDIARRFVPAGEEIVSMRWLDTQVASRERRLDKGLLVQLRDHRLVIHVEWCIDDDPDLGWRMLEYVCALLAAIRAEDLARYEAERKRAEDGPGAPAPRPPDPVYVRSCAVMLDGAAAARPPVASWSWSEPAAPPEEECAIRYRVDAVYQRTTAELLAEPGVLWLAFAPLAKDVSEESLRRAVQAARERATSREELDDLASAMHVVATARPRGHNLTQRILEMFKEEGLIERTWLFQHGVEKGIEKGIEKGREEGREKGREEGARALLFSVLAARGLKLTAAQRARVEGAHALETLQAWAARAATAQTAAGVFSAATPTPTRKRK